MKKLLRSFVAVLGVTLMLSGCDEAQMEQIQGTLEELNSMKIATIKQQMENIQNSVKQLENVDKQLGTLTADLRKAQEQENVDGVSAVIEKLESADATLKQRIAGLKEYCEKHDTSKEDWTTVTFSTLEQHNQTLADIAEVKDWLLSEVLQSTSNLGGAYSKRIADDKARLTAEIDTLETSMKTWVNEQLAGYYTAAQIDAKLKALGNDGYYTGDETLSTEIATLRQSLEDAKAELTAAYQQAIAAAITEYDGVITKKISDDIKTATDTMQEQIDALSGRIDALESRVAALEASVAKLINMIQSVVVVPDYSDGSVAMAKVADNAIRFEVYPLDAAAAIAQNGPSILSLDYVGTITKSSEDFVNLPITAVSFTGKTLLLTVDGSNLPDDVMDGTASASARLKISDGTNTRSSEYFPLHTGNYTSSQIAVTGEATDITELSATLYGWSNLEPEDGEEVKFGVEVTDTDFSRYENTWVADQKDSDNKYSCRFSWLQPNTHYYYRAFTLYKGVRYYGEVKSFNTLDFTFSVTTMEATDITELRATLNGSLTVESIEPFNPNIRFFVSKTATTLDEMLSDYQCEVWPIVEEDGTFHCEISEIWTNGKGTESLIPNTTYYYIAIAETYNRTSYGEVKSFTTLDISASVDTPDPTEITSNTATITGSLTVNSTENLRRVVGILYSETISNLEELKTNYTYCGASSLYDDGSFVCDLSALSPNTTYYYTVRARVGYQQYHKDFYGEVKSFTTLDKGSTTIGDGSESNPYSPSKIASLILEGNAPSDNVYIKGVVSAVLYPFSASHGTATFWISEDGTAYGISEDNKKTTEPTKDFECYNIYWLGNRPWTDGDEQIAVGEEVVICGMVTSYNGIAETSGRKAWIHSLKNLEGNYVSPAKNVIFLNEFDATNKKIEIYNASNVEVDMTGWTLSKDEIDWTIPAGRAKVPAKGYIVYTAKSDGTTDPTFGLSGTKGFRMVLTDASGNVVDDVDNITNIVTIGEGQSWGRITDGADQFVVFDSPSIGSANGSVNPSEPPVGEDNPSVPDGEYDSYVQDAISNLNSAYTDGVATVNGVENVFTIKFGTSSKYGSATVTLPAGTKSLSFYGVAWRGAPASLKITFGDTVISVDLAANDGATGSSPYTLSVTEADNKFGFELGEALAADTPVTIETYEGNNTGKRAIIFGIQTSN